MYGAMQELYTTFTYCVVVIWEPGITRKFRCSPVSLRIDVVNKRYAQWVNGLPIFIQIAIMRSTISGTPPDDEFAMDWNFACASCNERMAKR
jgi:hypothetical protein